MHVSFSLMSVLLFSIVRKNESSVAVEPGHDRRRVTDSENTVLDSHDHSSVASQDRGETQVLS